MIALSIIALAATVVAPSLSASVGQASRRAAELEVQASLIALRRSAVRSAETVVAAAPTRRSIRPRISQNADGPQDEVATAELPAPRGWTLSSDARIVIRPDGSCEPATLVLEDGLGRSFPLNVKATCRIRS